MWVVQEGGRRGGGRRTPAGAAGAQQLAERRELSWRCRKNRALTVRRRGAALRRSSLSQLSSASVTRALLALSVTFMRRRKLHKVDAKEGGRVRQYV